MFIGFETVYRYYKLAKRLYTQFGPIRSNHRRICYRDRD
jgi:hypothetical protein